MHDPAEFELSRCCTRTSICMRLRSPSPSGSWAAQFMLPCERCNDSSYRGLNLVLFTVKQCFQCYRKAVLITAAPMPHAHSRGQGREGKPGDAHMAVVLLLPHSECTDLILRACMHKCVAVSFSSTTHRSMDGEALTCLFFGESRIPPAYCVI